MHAYMRAIGLTDDKISEYEVGRLCDSIRDDHDHMDIVREEDSGKSFLEASRDLGRGFGLKVIGLLDESGFHRTSYFPYVMGTDSGSDGNVGIQSKSMGDSYIGVCNDGRIGAPLIFSLQNPGTYLRGRQEDPEGRGHVTTSFSALSLGGRILLPARSRAQQLSHVPSAWEKDRIHTVEGAKMGEEKAVRRLGLQNLDLYTMVQRRLSDGEDIFSIVDTYCIPYGMEADQYHILANIVKVTEVHNKVTGEPVWRMELECEGLHFDMCVCGRDTEGYPTAGMRFRGDIWMQGRINFLLPSAVS